MGAFASSRHCVVQQFGARMNYYEFHIGDYLKNTAHLSMLEDAAYRRLIDAYYTREAPLPAERRACYKLCRAYSKDEREAVDYVLDEFFDSHEDGWHNDRCDAEIFHFLDKQAKAKRSANARWAKRETHSEGNANASPDAMRTHSEGNATRARPQTPDTKHQGEPKKHRATASPPHVPDSIPADLLADWLVVRKAKRVGNLTETAWSAIEREAEIAGMSPEAAVRTCCERGWAGFRASWLVDDDGQKVRAPPNGSAELSAGQKTAAAAARWLESMQSQGTAPP